MQQGCSGCVQLFISFVKTSPEFIWNSPSNYGDSLKTPTYFDSLHPVWKQTDLSLSLALSLFLLLLWVSPSSMQERHKCGCEANNKEKELQLTPFPCNSHSACSHLRLTDRNGASMGYGVRKALFIAKRWKERQRKNREGVDYTWSRIHWKRGVWWLPPSGCTSSSLAWVEWSVSQYCSTMWSSSPTFHFFSLTLWTTAESWNNKSLGLKKSKEHCWLSLMSTELVQPAI